MDNDVKNMRNLWKKLMYILTPQQKSYGVLIFVMSMIGALFETLGVSVIIPMVNAMVSPQVLAQNKYTAALLKILHLSIGNDVIWLMCILVILVYVIKNAYLTLLSWARAKYSCKIMRELSIKVMKSYMKRDYSFFLNTSIGDLLRGTSGDVNGVYNVIYQGFRIISEGLTVLFICIYLFAEDTQMALSVIIVGAVCLILILCVFRNMMRQLGHKNREYASKLSKYILEAYEGIKEITVMQRQDFFIKRYENTYLGQQKITTKNTVAAESPAYVIEAICVSGIIMAVGVRVSAMGNPTDFIPKLAAFAMAAFRILPSLGKISNAFNSLVFNVPTLNATYKNIIEVDRAEKGKDYTTIAKKLSGNVKFENEIYIKNAHFRYEGSENEVLQGIEIKIKKGQSVGVIGTSGAGKSTLIDMILGLLHPEKGNVLVDGIDISEIILEWAHIIGYVPQTVYLTDDTIRNNVAFGIEEKDISDEIVWRALEDAHIAEFVRALPKQLDTYVGDRGVRFSGGQRQRLAIARALYYNPDILIFDEATSALDNETEKAVMESIDSLHGSKTLIIVAHRLTTIRNCDVVYEIADGKAVLV